MAFNTEVAASLAEEVLADLKRIPYSELAIILDQKVRRQMQGSDGVNYNIVAFSLPDAADSLRAVVAVDDGGITAMKPLVRDFIVSSDGTIVD